MEKNEIIFGIHPILEALAKKDTVDSILVDNENDSHSIDKVIQEARKQKISVRFVPKIKLDKISKYGNHQGVAAQLTEIEMHDLVTFIEKESPKKLLVLDGITDIRNFGAITRTAECAGFDALVLLSDSRAPLNAMAVKSSAGALLRIPVIKGTHIKDTLFTLQQYEYKLYGASEKTTQSLYETTFQGPLAVVMGDEGKGLSNASIKLCDELVKIPMQGNLGSLNVGNATAVVLFEIVRQEAIQA